MKTYLLALRTPNVTTGLDHVTSTAVCRSRFPLKTLVLNVTIDTGCLARTAYALPQTLLKVVEFLSQGAESMLCVFVLFWPNPFSLHFTFKRLGSQAAKIKLSSSA